MANHKLDAERLGLDRDPHRPPVREESTELTTNGRPRARTSGDAGNQLLSQVDTMVNVQKSAAGVLPVNFFSVPLPSNF